MYRVAIYDIDSIGCAGAVECIVDIDSDDAQLVMRLLNKLGDDKENTPQELYEIDGVRTEGDDYRPVTHLRIVER